MAWRRSRVRSPLAPLLSRDADHQERQRDDVRAGRMVHRRGLPRRGRGAVVKVAREREQRPLHAGRTHRLAHAPERPDDLGHRRARPLPGARRPDRGHPPRRPRLLRAGRGTLARRCADPVHDPSCHARRRRRGPSRRVARACDRRGVRRRTGHDLMRATVMYGAGDVRLEDVPDARLVEPTDAVVRVTSAAICGSDLWPYKSMEPSETGRRMGHEFIGVVEAAGEDVRTLEDGDLVVTPFLWSDGTCVFCREGLHTSCLHGGRYGDEGVDGGQGEAVRVPQADGTLVVLPVDEDDALMPSLLTLPDVMATGHHAARAANAGPGKSVAVVGDGAVGLCGVIAAKRLGAQQIIILGRHEARTSLAREFGATDVVSERGSEAGERVRELTDGLGVDSALECVGYEEATRTAMRIPRPGGAVGRVGIPQDESVPFAVETVFDNGTIGRRPAPARAYIEELMPDVLEGRIEPGRVFDRTGPLDKGPDGYRAMNDREALKVLIEL